MYTFVNGLTPLDIVISHTLFGFMYNSKQVAPTTNIL